MKLKLNKILNIFIKQFFCTKMPLELISSAKCHEGEQRIYSHDSKVLNCNMKFGVYLPPAVNGGDTKFAVLYFLSGLHNTYENFIQLSGMQQYVSKYKLIVVNADTSPRGINLPGNFDDPDFGDGAAFFLDATTEPWSKHYKMYTYVAQELPELIKENFPIDPTRTGICGHSMGGHGALLCALKNPKKYSSISVFAPLANLTECPIGIKALKGFVGTNQQAWEQWDATILAKNYNGKLLEIFVDQGSVDQWAHVLLTENFVNAAANNDCLKVNYKIREGYEHSFFFVRTFIKEHIDYHAKLLKA